MKLPDTPNKGDALEASWGADVVNYLRALTPQPSPTVKPSMKPGGTTYKAKAGSSFKDSGFSLPFEVTQGSSLTVDVKEGPVFHFDMSDLSTLFTLYSASGLELTDEATNGVYLKATLEAAVLNGVEKIWQHSAGEFVVTTSAPANTWVPSTQTDGDIYIPIATVVVADGIITALTQTLKWPIVLPQTALVFLSNPGAPTDDVWVLSHNGTASAWLSAKQRDCA